MAVPKYDDLFNPLLQALHQLGSSASIPELEDRVATNLNLTEQDISEIPQRNEDEIKLQHGMG